MTTSIARLTAATELRLDADNTVCSQDSVVREWMCTDCDQLLAHPSNAGHAFLRVTDARKQPGGLSRGVMFRYRCSACRFVWMRLAESTSGNLSWVGGYATGTT